MRLLIDYLNKKLTRELKYILLLFLVTRLALTIIGVLSRIILKPFGGSQCQWSDSQHLFLDIWGVWDSGWYLNIAAQGYSTQLSPINQANYAFFPLYPTLIKLLQLFIGNYYIAGLIVSNICLVMACILLFRLVRLKYDESRAMNAIKYVFLFPTAFILSAIFSDSLFLALLIACFYYARKEKWMLVGVLGYFLSLTKSIGVFAILPLLYEYFKGKHYELKNIKLDVLFLALLPIGLVTFMFYNYYLTGDFLAFVHIQQAWGRTLSNPIDVLINSLSDGEAKVVFEVTLITICLMLLSISYRDIGFSYCLVGMYIIFAPLSAGTTTSMPRYLLLAFPIYIVLGKLASNHYLDEYVTIALALLQGFLMVLWTNQFWFIV